MIQIRKKASLIEEELQNFRMCNWRNSFNLGKNGQEEDKENKVSNMFIFHYLLLLVKKMKGKNLQGG